MDLIGIPIRITVGKKITEGIVELKLRNDENTKEIKTSKLISQIQNIIEKSYWYFKYLVLKCLYLLWRNSSENKFILRELIVMVKYQ